MRTLDDLDVEGKRVFDLTEAGRERLAERGDSAPPWEQSQDRSLYQQLGNEIRGVASAASQVMLAAPHGRQTT